jgi:hypothetical protein
MSLLSKASLVITPNAVKESKLYSVVPSDGSGDLTVVRATTATRVNGSGLIEETPYNLLTYSQDYTNASWSKSGITISANVITSPNGNVNASKLVENGTLVEYGAYKGITKGFIYSHSIYAKKAERDWIKVNPIAGANKSVWFNLANGTIGTNNSGAPATIESVGNGWYRCIVNGANHLSGASFFSVMPCTNNNVETYTGTSGSGVYIWGAQLVTGTVAKEYFPTTDRLNVPRLDYTNSTCPSILVEPQRTNLMLRSNGLTNVYYGVTGATIAQSSTDFLNGEKAFLFSETNSNSQHGITNSSTISQTIGTTYTFSCYLKKGSGSSAPNIVRLRSFWGDNYANFNISTGQVLYTSTQLTSASIVPISNGYYRCSITWVGVVSTSTYAGIYFINNTNDNQGNVSYTGNVNANVFVAGLQYEAGANATSYIPTTSATVTRNADVISKTGISSLIGQTEGTVYAKFSTKELGTTKTILGIKSSNGQNAIIIKTENNNNLGTQIIANNTNVYVNNANVSLVTNSFVKIAVTYNSTKVKVFVNGALILQSGTISLSFTTLLEILSLGVSVNNFVTENINGKIDNALVLKTSLTDNECISLTTL